MPYNIYQILKTVFYLSKETKIKWIQKYIKTLSTLFSIKLQDNIIFIEHQTLPEKINLFTLNLTFIYGQNIMIRVPFISSIFFDDFHSSLIIKG